MRVNFSRRARSDLKDIADYIARDNPKRARSFNAELIQICRDLSDFSKRSPVEPAFAEGARRTVHGNYLIFYTLHPDQIRIDHIVHGARVSWRREPD